MYCKSATVSFCKALLPLWELSTVLSEEMYKNIYYALVWVHLLMGENGNEPVEKCCIVLNVKY